MNKSWRDLNTYSPDTQACPRCGSVGELVYMQYLDWWTCPECGADSDGADSDGADSDGNKDDGIREALAARDDNRVVALLDENF